LATNSINVSPSAQSVIGASAPVVTPSAQSVVGSSATVSGSASGSNPQSVLAANSGYGILRYPPDTGVYYLTLQVSQYTRNNINSPVQLNALQSITLPVPANLTDSTIQKFSPQERVTAVGMAGNHENGAAGYDHGVIGGIGGAALRGAGAIGNAIISGAGDATAQSFGVAPNPFLTIMYQSPNFKTHEFKWKFSPKTIAESLTVKQIINTLKYHSLSDVAGPGGAYFTYPDIFSPTLYPNADSLYVFQPCVLTSVVANYAPSGTPAFFAGSQAPAEVELRLSFLELALWVKSNYPQNNVVF